MLRRITFLFFLWLMMVAQARSQTPMQVYGVWHCFSDGCNWFSVPDMTTFDTDNHWLIDRGDGVPAVNVVVLSFVNPVDLMNLTNSSNIKDGIPIGMDAGMIRGDLSSPTHSAWMTVFISRSTPRVRWKRSRLDQSS